MAPDLWFHENDHRAHISRYVEDDGNGGFCTTHWIFRYWFLTGHKTDWTCASREEAEKVGREWLTEVFGG